MTISFNTIPQDWRVPGQFIEFDNSLAGKGLPLIPNKIMVFGQMLPGAQATPNVPVQVLSYAQAVALFGRGSMLAIMFNFLKLANPVTETWCIPQLDNAAGTAAAGSITVTGSPTVNDTLTLYVGGVLIQTPVTVGQGAASIAQALQAAIAANPDLPVTSAVTGAQITLTALHKGMDAGNSIDLRASYFAGDHLPAGVQLAITALSGGAGNPSIVPAIAVAAGWWNHWIMPYTDGPNVTALLTELDSRFGGLTERDGHAYLATTGSVGTLAAFGAQYNDAQQSVMGIQRPPQPTFAWAASVGAVAAFALNLDPARPLQTLPLPGIMAPALADRFVQTDRNLLLHDGIATFKVDDGGNVLIERLVTSYRANAAGLPDQSYLDIETLATLSYLRFSLRSLIAQKHPRDKLANNGTAFDAGQPIMTPALFIDEAIALALQWQEAGLVQGIDQFKASLIATINASDPSRLDALLQPELIGQFRVFAGKIQFLQ